MDYRRANVFLAIAAVVVAAAGGYGFLTGSGTPLATGTSETPAVVARGAGTVAGSAALGGSSRHVSATARLEAGGGAVAVVLAIDEGWHVNANPASMDFLIPTELRVQAGDRAVPARVDYPQGEMLAEGFEQPIAVYSGNTRLVARLDQPRPDGAPLSASVTVQACSNDGRCLAPSELVLPLELPAP